MVKGNPIKKAVSKVSRDMMDFLKNEFPDYEIEYVVADLELNIPLPLSDKVAKGSLKVTMKKKNREQNTEVIVEPQEPMKITK